MSRVAQQRSSVNHKPLISKAGKPPNVVQPRLSALAHCVAIYAQMGITSTSHLAKLTRYTKRAVMKAKAECAKRCNQALMGELGFVHLVNQGSPSVRHVVNQGSPSEDLPPLKKKGLPHTPSKEKTTPPSGSLPLSQITDVALHVDSSLPAILEIGPVKLSFASIDEHADLAGIEKRKGRALVRAMVQDWVVRDDVPRYPMSVISRAFKAQAQEDATSRREVREWGAGRG